MSWNIRVKYIFRHTINKTNSMIILFAIYCLIKRYIIDEYGSIVVKHIGLSCGYNMYSENSIGNWK